METISFNFECPYVIGCKRADVVCICRFRIRDILATALNAHERPDPASSATNQEGK